MRDNKMVSIDGEKLKKQILKRGYTLSSASEAIGMSDKYFGVVILRGSIPHRMTLLIDSVLGIDAALYIQKEESEDKVEPDIVQALAVLLARTEPEKLKEIVREVIQEIL